MCLTSLGKHTKQQQQEQQQKTNKQTKQNNISVSLLVE